MHTYVPTDRDGLLAAHRANRRRRLATVVGLIALGGAGSAVYNQAGLEDATGGEELFAVALVSFLAGLLMFAYECGVGWPNSRNVRRRLRVYDAEPVTWEIRPVPGAVDQMDLRGSQGTMAVEVVWSKRVRRRVLENDGGRLQFAGDFRVGGVLFTADLRRFRSVDPRGPLLYVEFGTAERDRQALAIRPKALPVPVLPADAPPEIRKFPAPEGYSPSPVVNSERQDGKGGAAGTWRMDADGIHLDRPGPMTVPWRDLTEVAFNGSNLYGRLHSGCQAPRGWPNPFGAGPVVLGPGLVLFADPREEVLRQFAADLETFARAAAPGIRVLVPATDAWAAHHLGLARA